MALHQKVLLLLTQLIPGPVPRGAEEALPGPIGMLGSSGGAKNFKKGGGNSFHIFRRIFF